LKFSLSFVLISLFVISPVYSKELTGIFIKFNKKNSTITVLTQQGRICLRFKSLSKEAFDVLNILRQGYVVSLDIENKIIKRIKIVEDPQ